MLIFRSRDCRYFARSSKVGFPLIVLQRDVQANLRAARSFTLRNTSAALLAEIRRQQSGPDSVVKGTEL